MRVAFTAPEMQEDGSIRLATYALIAAGDGGWEIVRRGLPHLRLGMGYRLLRVSHCGVCSTDMARHRLPFPLPQVLGHEVVVLDDDGTLAVVEINASHAARGHDAARTCAFCRDGLATHCPDRLVLGIHDLPGGFGPWLLAPIHSVVPVPAGVSAATAMLAEPFAAALHAVEVISPRDGDRIAVLGPRRLGALVVAALAAWRQRTGGQFEILAITRRPEMQRLARALGADETFDATAVARARGIAEVVIDTTGHPAGFERAMELAIREVHVKSTHGGVALGLAQLTALVVDELSLVPLGDLDPNTVPFPSPPARVAALLDTVPRGVVPALVARGMAVVTGADPQALAERLAHEYGGAFGAADLAVVSTAAEVDAVTRPRPGQERGLVRPRGVIAIADTGQPRDALLRAVLDRRLRVSASRCGDMHAALAVLADPATGLGASLGARMITASLPADRLAEAFALSAAGSGIKVAVTHPDTRL